MEQESSKAETVLSYGIDRKFRIPRRWVVLFVSLLVLIVAGWMARPLWMPLWGQAVHLRSQYRISHQVLPAGTVIYTEDPQRISALSKLSDYRSKTDLYHHNGWPWSANFPTAWERAYVSGSFLARDTPNGPVERYQVDNTFGYLRTSKGGIDWIVHLDQVNPLEASGGGRKVSVTQVAFRPVGWTPGARGLSVSYMSRRVLLKPSDIFTLFAPQPDPKDKSRITIGYELNGQSGVLDAVITDRGYVQIDVGSGPAKVVKWNSK